MAKIELQLFFIIRSYTEMSTTVCQFCILGKTRMNYTGSVYNEYKDRKDTTDYKWVLVVTEPFNIAVNVHYSCNLTRSRHPV